MEKIEIEKLVFYAREHGPFGKARENAHNLMRKDKKYLLIGQLEEQGKSVKDLATGKIYPLNENQLEIDGDVFKNIRRNRDYELEYIRRKRGLAIVLENRNFDLMSNDFFFLEYLALPGNKKVASIVEKIFDFVYSERTTNEKEIKLVDSTYNDLIHSFYNDLAKSFEKEMKKKGKEDPIQDNGI